MAFKLLLKDDTDSIDFLSAAYRLRDRGFDLWTPKKKQVWGGESVYSHGSQLVTSTFENRRLRMWFEVTGATRDELASNISAIENLLEKARQRSIEQTGSRVELQYQWDGSSGITYFEIIDGELRWPKDTMSVEQVHQKDEKGNYIITDFYLTFIMAPFAYPISPVSGAPTELAISNGIEILKKNGSYFTMEPLNMELTKADVYDKLIQKQITSWGELRNKAAHGHYDEYDEKQVEMMLLFVQKFVSDHLK